MKVLGKKIRENQKSYAAALAPELNRHDTKLLSVPSTGKGGVLEKGKPSPHRSSGGKEGSIKRPEVGVLGI